jgi:tetratricopeptide (TPR) repeat protein
MKLILNCVLLAIVTSPLLAGAQDQTSEFASLSALSRNAQPSQLIQAANSLLANRNLDPSSQGIVLTYLGHGYQQAGDFQKAAASYEKALANINCDGLHAAEYATILTTLATLYAETGQTDIAKHVLRRSVRLFEKQNNRAGTTMIWNDLATIAADEHQNREAHKYIARAMAESQLGSDVPADEIAALTSTEARIAELDGDPKTAITYYQRSLALCNQSCQSQQIAWLHILLGGAYLEAGDIADALAAAMRGLSLVEASFGRQSPRFFSAELICSKVLDASGAHTDAARLRTEAEAGQNNHTAHDEITVAALR